MARQRWRWRVIAPAALAVGVLSGALREGAGGVFGRDPWNWAEFAFSVVWWALLLPLLWWWQRWLVTRESFRRLPDARNRQWREQHLRPVLRSGELPDGDRAAWRRPMRDEKQELEVVLWTWLTFTVLAAGLTGTAAIVANDNAWTVWAVAVVAAAQGAFGARLLWPTLRTARRLLAELDGHRVEP